ncbi:MAG: amidohydrolase family protein [Myxococcales bacterium]|nr:amidohydrolase family protein [Myxococcales bacterium]
MTQDHSISAAAPTSTATSALDVSVIDAHVHLWDPLSTPRVVSPLVRILGKRPTWMARVAPFLFPRATLDFVGRSDFVVSPHLPGDLRREQAGFDVRGFVHIQAGWHVRDPLQLDGETSWLESLCGPDLLAIVGAADLAHPRLAELLERHRAASPRFVGVRDMLAFHSGKGVMSWCSSATRSEDPAWRRGFALLGEDDLSFDAWCYAEQLPQLSRLLEAHPGTRVVLDHLGTPVAAGGPFGGLGQGAVDRERILADWRAQIRDLARHPQLSVKISGLLMPVLGFALHTRAGAAGKAASPAVGVNEIVVRLRPFVEHALETFGVDRCIFASNFPMDKVSLDWATLFGAYAELTASYSADERRRLFHDNAARFYRIDGPHALTGARC